MSVTSSEDTELSICPRRSWKSWPSLLSFVSHILLNFSLNVTLLLPLHLFYHLFPHTLSHASLLFILPPLFLWLCSQLRGQAPSATPWRRWWSCWVLVSCGVEPASFGPVETCWKGPAQSAETCAWASHRSLTLLQSFPCDQNVCALSRHDWLYV